MFTLNVQRGLDICISIVGRLLLLIFGIYAAYFFFAGRSGLQGNVNRLAANEGSLKVRLAKIEDSMKAATKMMQVDNKMVEDKGESFQKKLREIELMLTRLQVEVKAIEDWSGSFRKELVVLPGHIKQLEDKGKSHETKLKEMQFLSTRLQVQVEAIDQRLRACRRVLSYVPLEGKERKRIGGEKKKE